MKTPRLVAVADVLPGQWVRQPVDARHGVSGGTYRVVGPVPAPTTCASVDMLVKPINYVGPPIVVKFLTNVQLELL